MTERSRGQWIQKTLRAVTRFAEAHHEANELTRQARERRESCTRYDEEAGRSICDLSIRSTEGPELWCAWCKETAAILARRRLALARRANRLKTLLRSARAAGLWRGPEVRG